MKLLRSEDIKIKNARRSRANLISNRNSNDNTVSDGTMPQAEMQHHLGTGNHNHHNLPWVIAGKARGRLKTGQFLNVSNNMGSDEAGNVANIRMLNSVPQQGLCSR